MNYIDQLALYFLQAKIKKPDALPQTTAETASNGLFAVAFYVAGITAVIVLIIAGIMYMTSAGDPGKAAKAKNMIIYTIAGLIVLVSATAIIAWVRSSVMGK